MAFGKQFHFEEIESTNFGNQNNVNERLSMLSFSCSPTTGFSDHFPIFGTIEALP
jgi:hypothetical protein